MNTLRTLACSSILAFSCTAFAEGFYFQGGGGAGFVPGAINQAGTKYSEHSPLIQTPIVDDTSSITGNWIVGLGYMFTRSFGLEANYLGYANVSSSKTQLEDNLNRKYQMSTDVYQINLLGVARTPFELGLGFFVKAKAGVGYTDQQQDVTVTDNVGSISYLSNNQSDKKFTPVLGIGIERDFTDLVSVSIEYMAAINNEVENSTVFLAVKFNPFDFIGY